MASCDGFPQKEDLQVVKESIDHITHVAKSVDSSGAPALTVTDPIDDTQVTNLTLNGLQQRYIDAINALGWQPAGTFQAGATVTSVNGYLIDTSTNIAYKWEGVLPKTVAAGSTPASTGGIAKGAWQVIDVTDVLRRDLATANGASMVGYTNPSSLVAESVKLALDKLNTRIIYAKDFGVNATGGDDTDALYNLGNFISNSTVPLYVIFPKGISLVGSQELAGATGKGYAYRPSYFSKAWSDASDMGWFSVHRTNLEITLDMSGWTIKMNTGMKLGSYNPTTGASYTPGSLPFYNYDYQSSQGYLIKIYQAPNVTILRGTSDGNLAGAVWGGNFGDVGYQVPAYNIWFNTTSGVQVYNHVGQNSPLDVFYIGETGNTFQPTVQSQIKGSYFKGCVLQDGGRNIISYTGGANAIFEDCEVWRAGNNATGITNHGSGPASCLDVESEGGAIINLKFKRCKFMYGGNYGVIGGFPTPNDVTDVLFDECIIHSLTGDYAYVNYARNNVLKDCTIYGGVSGDTGTKQDPTSFIRCKFYNRVAGVYIPKFTLSGFVNNFQDCTVFYEIPTTATTGPIIALSGLQPLVGGYGNAQTVRNLRIDLSGNSANLTNFGYLAYYGSLNVNINGLGLTGTNPISLVCTNSTADLQGLTSTGTALVNFGGTMVNQPGSGIYYDTAVPTRVGGLLQPVFDNTFSLGKKGNSFREVRVNLGVITYSPNGTQYRVRVNDSGAVYAVVDAT